MSVGLAVIRDGELIAAAQAGDEAARDALLKKHDRFLWKVARRYAPPGEEEDYYQNAAIHFLEAVGRFDLSRGFQLLTFAACWVAGRLLVDRKNTQNLIRVPVYVDRSSEAYLRVCSPASIDVDLDGDGPWADRIADHSWQPPDVDTREEADLLRLAIARLDPRSRGVVEARMRGVTCRAIGEEIGVSYGRVQQIEAAAHERIREMLADAPRLLRSRAFYRRWNRGEEAFIRQHYDSLNLSELSSRLGRPYVTTMLRAHRLGLRKNKPSWSEAEDRFLREHRERGWKWCAEQLPGRALAAVYSRVKRLGIQNKRLGPDDEAAIRALHAAGHTTGQIGLAVGVSGECIRVNLLRLGLKPNPRDEESRMRSLRESLAKRGFRSVTEVRLARRRRQAFALGWGDCPLFEALILEALGRIGRPADRNEIAAARAGVMGEIGVRTNDTRGGWYAVLAAAKRLCDRGAVVMTSPTGAANRLRLFWFADGLAVPVSERPPALPFTPARPGR